MTRYLLDTNVISNVIKPNPSPTLLEWMAEQNDIDLFISALTVAELQRGVLEKPKGRKRTALETWFTGPEGPQAVFAGRVLPFQRESGSRLGTTNGRRHGKGQPRSALDMIVAAIAEANGCIVVTDNDKHFNGLKFINPLRA